jgi:hypothetical protein
VSINSIKQKAYRLYILIIKVLLKRYKKFVFFVVFINLTFCALVKVRFKYNTMTTNFVLMVMIFIGVIEAKEEVADL